MPKNCSNCNASQPIKLKQKWYCANCGQRLAGEDASEIKTPASPITNAQPIQSSMSHQHSTKRVQIPISEVGETITSSSYSENLPKKMTERRLAHAKRSSKHRSISKFTHQNRKSLQNPTNPRRINPNHSYNVAQDFRLRQRKPKPVVLLTPQAGLSKFSKQDIKRLTTSSHPKPVRKLSGWLSNHRGLVLTTPIALIALVVTAYVSYLNIPSLSLRVAAARAGITNASLPSHLPSGFSYSGPVSKTGRGEIKAQAVSKNGGTLTITEKTTGYIDPDSLLESYVKPLAGCQVDINQCVNRYDQNGGLTIFVFNGRDAIWVFGNVLYTINGQDTTLQPDQILSLAASF